MGNYLDLYRSARSSGLSRFEITELLSYALGKPKSEILRGYEVSEAAERQFTELLNRRLSGEPLAYIFGEWEFYGLPMFVNPSVLIPRPDSEPLVDTALEYLRSFTDKPRILDLCCGSGCLGLAVIANCPDSALTAVDISRDALDVTLKNSERLKLRERVTALRLDVLREPPDIGGYDVIISNPPYVTKREMDELDASVKDYEPHLALYGGVDGLDFYRSVCGRWARLLNPDGALILECAYAQGEAVRELSKHIKNCSVIPTGGG